MGGLCAAAPTRTGDVSVGNWTILSLNQVCIDDNVHCNIRFLLSENSSLTPHFCSFDVNGTAEQPAVRASFGGRRCSETDRFMINSGWDVHGFTVITLIDEQEQKIAYFGYNDQYLAYNKTAAPVTSYVYNYRPKRQMARAIGAPGEETGAAALEQASSWLLTHNTRVVSDGGVELHFNITSPNVTGHSIDCDLKILSSNPRTMSFWGTGCLQNNWTVSWDYTDISDAAVMTLINPTGNLEAFFGWDNINSANGELLDVGPNPTQPHWP